jgi:hypothetical protein
MPDLKAPGFTHTSRRVGAVWFVLPVTAFNPTHAAT